MESFSINAEIRWADLDPNFHVLHSKYYDFGAFCRMAYLFEKGLTPQVMQDLSIGPILLREDCFFKRELKFGDEISINFFLTEISSNYSRWSIEHEIIKNRKKSSAIIHVDGAWMDTQKRKMTVPDQFIRDIFDAMPKSVNFQVKN